MEKMNKTIFLDRDGTIIKDHGYMHNVHELEFTNNAFEGLKKLNDNGFQLIIVTNQSGIGRGYYSKEDFINFNNYMISTLEENGIIIKKTFYCPHIESDNCDCRKPKTKLFYDAINEFNVDLNNSYVIGDRERDLSISLETQINSIMVFNRNEKYLCKKDLLEAASEIMKRENENISSLSTFLS